MPLADERGTVQVKLWDPSRTRHTWAPYRCVHDKTLCKSTFTFTFNFTFVFVQILSFWTSIVCNKHAAAAAADDDDDDDQSRIKAGGSPGTVAKMPAPDKLLKIKKTTYGDAVTRSLSWKKWGT